MHVPEVQRPRARSASQSFRSSTSTTSQGYLHTQPSPDQTVHSTVDLPHPNYGATPPAIPTTDMIPGGFSAPYYADQHQQPRTHGLDYSQWVATFSQGQQPSPYGAQHHYTQSQQAPHAQQQQQQSQAPVFGGQFHPSTSAIVNNGRQPRDSLSEIPPRIGGAYQSTPQQGYYIHSSSSPPSILTQEEQAQIYNGFPGSGYDPTPPPQVSPAASTSPIDTAPAGASAVPGRAKPKRKRARRNEVNEVGSGDESDDGGGGAIRVGSDAFSTRLPGACTHCKKLKMKCDFPPDATVCKRCKNSGHQCVVEGRKPRSAPNKREYLMAQLRQKDAVIESLLKQINNPFVSTPLSIGNYRSSVPVDQQNQNVVAWLDRLKNRPSASTARPHHVRSSLSPSDALREGGGASDVESVGASGENGEEGLTADDDDSGEGTAESLVESERLIPDQAFPVGLFANLSLSATRKSTRVKAAEAVLANPDAQNEDDVGVANETYFMPGPATDLRIRQRLLEQTSPPEILLHGLVTPDDVDRLFDIFFKRINIFFPLLDSVLHTPASTFSRCPFLFTVICAISSRYDTEKAEIYPLAMHFAKSEASAALIKGWKSVELCQAYILMAVYGPPARRWEEDRGWIFTGLAIRVAMDLNMHIPSTSKPQSERQAREALNKTRTWMICYNMDRSTGTQFGKPCTIKDEYIECHPPDFYKSSPYNSPYDVHICGYNALLRIVGQMHTELYSGGVACLGVNKRLDLQTIIPQFDEKLTRYHDEWYQRIEERRIPNDPIYEMRSALLPFVVGYSKLVLHSFAFQQAFVRGVQPADKPMFNKCLDAAKSTVETFITRLAPSGNMRYSPDGWFLIASFASAFLFKLLRPQFKSLVSQDQETEILELVGRLIQTLSSPDIAIDDRHTPKVYARFLAGLLSRHRREGVASFSLQINPPPPMPTGGGAGGNNANSGFMPQGQQTQQQSHTGGYQQQQQGYAPSSGYTVQQPGTTTADMQQAGDVFTAANVQSAPQITYNFGNDPVPDNWSDDGHPASMQVLHSQAWWDQMMLPGFSWPPSSPGSNSGGFPASTIPNNMAGGMSSYPMQLPIH